jgi:hypothetical protein
MQSMLGQSLTLHLHLGKYTKNDILCHYNNYLDDTSYEQVNKSCHE